MSLLNPSRAVRLLLALTLPLVSVACGEAVPVEEPPAGVEVVDVGLQAPRAVIYDVAADVYLVSNMNGGPLDEDENGFISRISPDGEVLALNWIPNVGSTDRLNAPKGMAIRGDTLFITDLDCIHSAERESGELIETRCLDEATSLSGIDVAPEGSVFVTDSGFDLVDGQTTESSTDGIYRLTFRANQAGATLAQDPDLNHPIGLAVGSRGIFVTTAGGDLFRFTAAGERTSVLATEGQVYEGVVFVADGGFAYSSSTNSAVYVVDGTGSVRTLATGLDSPGDIGYDSNRDRVLVPLLQENRLIFLDLQPAGP